MSTSSYTLPQVKLSHTHTFPQLLDAIGVQLGRAPEAVLAIQESQVVCHEALLLQQVGYELAILATSEWVEICCRLNVVSGL